MLQDFGHTVFARDSDLPAASFPLPPLNSSSLAKQIGSIQPHKAVPEGSAPSSVYKLCATLVASNMTAFLQRPQIALPLQGEVASSDQPGSMPTSATSADLCFIPKPGKPPSHPTSLRPLGIIRPLYTGTVRTLSSTAAPVDLFAPRQGPNKAVSWRLRFIFKKAGQDVSAEEVEGFLTGFADDLIVHKDIYCWRDLEIAHQLALSLLAHLEAAGFSVHPTKCCVMYRLGRLLTASC